MPTRRVVSLPLSVLAAGVLVCLQASGQQPPPPDIPKGYKLVYEQIFSKPAALADFSMSDPGAWTCSDYQGSGTLELTRQSEYKPLVRSPVNIALIKEWSFSDFVLEVDLLQTGREYGHRDMCLYFGFQNPTNFYYAHIATAADDHAHNVFIVKNAPRTKIAKETTTGAQWGLNQWHKIRLERNATSGSIRVFFDDMTRPIMTGEDRTFSFGHIGFGSFDDTGRIDNIRVWAPKAEKRPSPL